MKPIRDNSTGYLAVTVNGDGIRLEHGARNWKIRRRQLFGFSVGLVWGPMRRPLALPGVNPWKERAFVTLRFPWLVGPWVYFWVYRKRHKWKPACVYFGLKIIEANDPPNDVWARPSERGLRFVTPSFAFRTGVR